MPYGDCICEVPGCIGPCVTRAKSMIEAPELSPYETGLCLLWLRDRNVIDAREFEALTAAVWYLDRVTDPPE